MDKYNVLLIGGGGREHALAWKLSQSERLGKLYISPGNPGTSEYGQNIALDNMNFEAVHQFISMKRIELVIVGPEAPLVEGITDYLEERNVPVFGPRKAAARLEGSKEFAKEFMKKYEIPTADYAVFGKDEFDDALTFIQTKDSYPIVLKADGLAAGKGVFICYDEEEVRARLESLKTDSNLADAAERLVVEEFMQGEEASVFVISDGHTSHILHNAQDHKRIGEGDTGLNTGGMGAYCPAPVMTDDILMQVREQIIEPTITGMQLEESAYTGILYLGLMITDEGPKVVEYNCRFGDPEAQVVLPSLENDLLDLCLATTEQRLDERSVQMNSFYYCCVVLSSKGYPKQYEKGKQITGINQVDDHVLVFHAGTKMEGDRLLTDGGRVLNVVGRGTSLKDAIETVYYNIDHIQFENCYYRRDIGHKGLARLS